MAPIVEGVSCGLADVWPPPCGGEPTSAPRILRQQLGSEAAVTLGGTSNAESVGSPLASKSWEKLETSLN